MGRKSQRGGDAAFCRIYLKTRREQIGCLRFILESYDGVGFIRTVDAAEDIVEFSYPPSQTELARRLLEALAIEMSLERVDPPEGVVPL